MLNVHIFNKVDNMCNFKLQNSNIIIENAKMRSCEIHCIYGKISITRNLK